MTALLTADEAARRIGVCAKTLGRLRRAGHIQFVAKTDHRFAYHPDDCDAYLASRRGFANAPAPKQVKTTRTARVIALPRFTERRA